MMKSPIIAQVFSFILLILPLSGLSGQTVTGRVIHADSGEPIGDVFVFVSNSSNGTITDTNGLFALEVDHQLQVQLFFSHLNYEIRGVELDQVGEALDTFRLFPRAINLQEATVAAKSNPAIRKRRLRAFTQALLGTASKSLVKIKNPEVLLFRENQGELVASAAQPIIIENSLLGYEVTFFLEKFSLLEGDMISYDGTAFFSEMEASRRKIARFRKNRKRVYEASSKKFFTDLLAGKIDDYRMGFADKAMEDNTFENFQAVDSLMIIDSIDGCHEVMIPGYLTVVKKDVAARQTTKRTAATSTFAFKTNEVSSSVVSYLYSRSGRIQLDESGRLLNPKDIEEYGFWTTLRVGALLPADY